MAPLQKQRIGIKKRETGGGPAFVCFFAEWRKTIKSQYVSAENGPGGAVSRSAGGVSRRTRGAM